MQTEAIVSPDLNTNPPIPLFVSANKGPEISPDIERIAETIYAIDASKDYDDLEKNLVVGEERGDFRTLQQHLDKAEDRARRAHRLYLGAKLERARWELDAQVTNAAMRKAAVDDLETDKAAGRKKQITESDVTAKMAQLFPDEFRSQEIKRAKLKGVEEHLERLAELWKGRCHSLGTMLNNLRK